MSNIAIATDGLTKEFHNGRGCRDVSIQVGKGEAFGFLGPNGAGKSTFVKMLVGLISPTDGQGLIFGEPIGSIEAKRRIGYLPELYRYQEWLTGEEVVRLHAQLCGMNQQAMKQRVPQILEEVGIGLRGKDRVKHYSKGMQQRLGLACALINDPDIVFLDEPSSALDPIGRQEVRSILARLKAEGKTIFLNSHLLEEVEVICDRIALLNDGQILRSGHVSDVLQTKICWQLKVGGFSPFLLSWLRETSGFQVTLMSQEADGTAWFEVVMEHEEQVGWFNSLIIRQGMTLYEVSRKKERLEKWFMSAVSGLSHRGEWK